MPILLAKQLESQQISAFQIYITNRVFGDIIFLVSSVIQISVPEL